jgi:hypothetical protein
VKEMTVQEIINNLNKVEDKSLPVFVIDTRSGVSDSASCYGSVQVNDGETDGGLLEYAEGASYIPIYVG